MNDKYLTEFIYLDELRESGEINMMGAPRELQYEFDIDKIEARKILGCGLSNLAQPKTLSNTHNEGKLMRMKRIHMVELSRFYQRIENAEKRRKKPKKSLLRRIFNVK